MLKVLQLFFIRKLSEKQQICDFFKTKSLLFYKAVYYILYIVSAVIEFARNCNFFFIFVYLVALNVD